MIKSMTGYGSASGKSGNLNITVELRSVNNRYLDCNIRIPRIYTAVEDALRGCVQKHVSRGKVDVYVTIDSSEADDAVITVNKNVAGLYVQALDELSRLYGVKNDLSAIALAKFPDVLTVKKEETDTDELAGDLCAIMEEALAGYDNMRMAEGEKLKEDILGRLQLISELTSRVEERSPKTVAAYRERLVDKMAEILNGKEIDEGRILLEAAIFADKVAVDEETVRLRSHLSQLEKMLDADKPVGRKIDFLIQELNREANTIGSKCNDTEMAQTVVDIKAEIEKIREQVQNIE